MKPFLLAAIATLLLLTGCVGSKTFSGLPKQMPKGIQEYPFGMEMREFERSNPDAYKPDDDNMGFRIIYIEDNPSSDIESIVYYFDNEGRKPLYEYIINYRNATVRDAWTKNNLGEENHADGKEWLFTGHRGYEINVWTFNNKLVFAAAIPGSEWDENKDGKIDKATN